MEDQNTPFTKRDNIILEDIDINNSVGGGNLKPCPFCGCTRVYTSGRKNETSGNIVFQVMCADTAFECRATISTCLGGEETISEARAKVIAAWNKRP